MPPSHPRANLQGGKSPLIVWKDVDVDKAVEDAHFGLFFNVGSTA